MVISICKILKIEAMELEIHTGFDFSDSTGLAMSKIYLNTKFR